MVLENHSILSPVNLTAYDLSCRRPYGFDTNQAFIDHLKAHNDSFNDFIKKLFDESWYAYYKPWGYELWHACYFKAAYHPKPWRDAPEYHPPTESPYDPD